MSKFIIKTLLFFVYTLVVYFLCIVVIGEYAPNTFKKNLIYLRGGYGHFYSRLKDAGSMDSVDVLILGSSHAYRGFDTRLFSSNGYKTFNLGSSAQTPLQTEVLMRKYFKKINPKVVIYEVYPGSFSSDGVESSLDLLANKRTIDFNDAIMALRINKLITYNTLMYSFFKKEINNEEDYDELRIKGNDTYIPKSGFVERKIAYYKNKKIKFQNNKWVFNEKQLKAFGRIMNLIPDSTHLILIQAPITEYKYKSYVNNKEIDNYFKSKGTYKNFNTTGYLNDSLHFYDADHLNQNGVKIFNKTVLNYLVDNDILK